MSGELSGGNEKTKVAARYADAKSQVEALLRVADQPLTLLPMAYRPAVLDFWTFWGHFLKDQLLTLCKRISVFINEERLTAADVAAILTAVNRDSRKKPILFAPELYVRIDSTIEEFVRLRRIQSRAEAAKNSNVIVRNVAAGFAERFRNGPR